MGQRPARAKPAAMPRGQATRKAGGDALRSPPPAIVLYDGSCGTCTVNMERGKRYQRPGALEWVDNGSEEGQALLRGRGLLGKEQDTLIVLEGDRAYLDSDAVVRSAQGLRW